MPKAPKPKGKTIKIRLVPRPFKGKAPKGLIGRITGRN
jgi:hypothetical protein